MRSKPTCATRSGATSSSCNYQTLIHSATREVCGVEALVRWRHPRRGLLGPDRFIAVAEETGLIVSLGEWILRRACSDAIAWPAHIKLAVNCRSAVLGSD
jgi:EAL domain-containing protein (putative c-di-GMP-specific phosphodiesterase class I)